MQQSRSLTIAATLLSIAALSLFVYVLGNSNFSFKNPAQVAQTSPATIAFIGTPYVGQPNTGMAISVSVTLPSDGSVSSLEKINVTWGDGTSYSASPQAFVSSATQTFNIGHSYVSAGSYVINFSLIDSNGGKKSLTTTTTVANPSAPIVTLNAPSYTVNPGQNLSFSGTVQAISSSATQGANNKLKSYTITYGDGQSKTVNTNSSSLLTIQDSHIYANAGTYTLTLKATDYFGSTNQTSSPVNVGTTLCVMTLSPSQTNLSSIAQTGTAVMSVAGSNNCNWTASSDSSWLTITSARSGTGASPVTYSVSANTGSARSGTITVNNATLTVTQAAQNLPPTVSFSGAPYSGVVGQVISISGTINDPDSQLTSHNFNFGDSTSNSTTNFNPPRSTPVTASTAHIYSSPGVYTVTLSGTDNGNPSQTGSGTAVVNVSSAQVACAGSAQNVPFVKIQGGAASDSTTASVVDSAGNIYVTGYFMGTVDVGCGPMVSSGSLDMFIVKYNSSGIPQWSKRYGAVNSEQPAAIALDSAGNIFVGGSFYGTANLGGNNFTSAGDADAFIAKYNSQGDHLWSIRFGANFPDVVRSLATDSERNLIVGGFFQGTVNVAGTTIYSWGTGIDPLLAKFTTNGTLSWVKNFYNAGTEYANTVLVDKSNNIYAIGYFNGYINFATNGADSNILNEAGGYIAKFGPTGNHIWSEDYGINGSTRFWTAALDASGDIGVGGDFPLSTNLGSNCSLTGASWGLDLFVAKFSGTDGACQSSRALVGYQATVGRPQGMAADSSNNFVVTGYFQGQYTSGSQAVTSNSGAQDGFIVKFSNGLAPIWIQKLGGTHFTQGTSISTSGLNPVVTGSFTTAATIVSGMSNSGNADGFILKLNP